MDFHLTTLLMKMVGQKGTLHGISKYFVYLLEPTHGYIKTFNKMIIQH